MAALSFNGNVYCSYLAPVSLLEVGLWQRTHVLGNVSKSREVTYETDILHHKILVEFNE